MYRSKEVIPRGRKNMVERTGSEVITFSSTHRKEREGEIEEKERERRDGSKSWA